MPRGKAVAIALRDGNDLVTLELPPYAARYLMRMCERERLRLNNFASTAGDYGVGIDVAMDALLQIERALQ